MNAPDPGYGDPATRTRILDAAWELIEAGGAEVTMAAVAERAGVSRQAVYLHFEHRAGLLAALVEHMDERLGLAERLRPVREAPSGRAALEALVALHATYHTHVIGVARLLDAARLADPDAAAALENRMTDRIRGHRAVVQRLADEGELAAGWDVESAALLLYAVTIPRTWDELVVERGWSTDQYREHVTRLLVRAFVASG